MAAGQGAGVDSFLPRDLHLIEVGGLQVVDLRAPNALLAVGLTLRDLSDPDWAVCQRVGDAADTLGLGGVLAPSATGVGDVLAVFIRHAHRGQLKTTLTTTLAIPDVER
jgi:RES domain-containing protein